MFTVYMHVHTESGKKYIGITKNKPEYRWNCGKGYPSGYFHNAIEKYGWDAFRHEILYDGLTKDEACKLEQELIAKHQTNNAKFGYNSSVGGELSALGCHWSHSEEAKRKMRHPKSEEHRKRIAESKRGEKHPMYGRHFTMSEEAKHKISRPRSEEAKRRMRKPKTDAHKKHISESKMGENNPMAKKVAQFTRDGQFVRVWDCMQQAQRELGINGNNIGHCCEGRRKTAGGYRWERWTDPAEQKE